MSMDMDRRTMLTRLGIGVAAAAAASATVSQASAAGEATPAAATAGAAPRKVAVITGVSSGIGYATALALAEKGVDTIGTFRRNEAGARQLVAEAGKHGARVVPFHLDLNHMDSIARFRDDAVAALRTQWQAERFDYLVNNAGFGEPAMLAETSEALFDELMRVLLKGPYFVTQGFLPHLKDGAAIVNVTSNSALSTGLSAGYSAYGSMKGGFTVLTRYMAKEFAARGIRVNSVAPGPTRTRIGNDGFARHPEVIPPLVAQTALGRLGEARDLGNAVAGLLADEFGWLTGENIEVSGGFRM